MFYFSKCTQPCSQSALHFLLFSFLWFTDKNTWGGKKAQYQIPGGSDLPQEKNVARCITGAHAHAGSKEAQRAEQSTLTQMLWCQELPTTSPAMRAVSHSVSIICHWFLRSSGESKEFFLLEEKQRAGQSFSPKARVIKSLSPKKRLLGDLWAAFSI